MVESGSQNAEVKESPRAFVSWAHKHRDVDAQRWAEQVFTFAAVLRKVGVDVDIDLVHLHDDGIDWAMYGVTAIRASDYVFVVASSAYKERWEGTGSPREGAGAAREANALKALFDKDRNAFLRKVKVVLLPGVDANDVPLELRSSAQRFDIPSLDAAGVEALLRTVTANPEWVLPAVGDMPDLPPRFVEGVVAANRAASPAEPAVSTPGTEIIAALHRVSAELSRTSDSERRDEIATELGTLNAALRSVTKASPKPKRSPGGRPAVPPPTSTTREPPAKQSDPLRCSFCGKNQRQVSWLIAGPNVYICNECSDLCAEIIDESASSNRAEGVSRICRLSVRLASENLMHEARQDLLQQLDEAAGAVRPTRRVKRGDKLAGARLIRIVGAGNFATVWEAETDSRRVAVKLFDTDKLSIGLMLWRFQRGIRAMRHLSELRDRQSVAICSLFEVSDDLLSFSMEFLPGGDLSRLPFLGWSRRKKYETFVAVCDALQFAHARGIVHRDVKPANIVLDAGGEAVLTDFDIADLTFAATQSVAAASLGTPHFAAPEQLAGELVSSPTADVFSLGKLLCYLITESSPPLGATEPDFEPRWLRNAIRNSALRRVIARCITYGAEERYQSVAELLDDLPAVDAWAD